MKLAKSILIKNLVKANKLVPVGATFSHYKGGLYRVTDLVINENTNEVMVVYVPDYGTFIKYTRPVAEWFQICDHFVPAEINGPGDTIYKVPRFELRSKYTEIPNFYSYKD